MAHRAGLVGARHALACGCAEAAPLAVARHSLWTWRSATLIAVARAGRRSSVLGDRLWDSRGQEWSGRLGEWATAGQVSSLLASGTQVVAHGFGRPFREFAGRDGVAYWQRVSEHFQVPGETGAEPDDGGLTYAAQVWTRHGDHLVGFVEFC
jgi:hypothetical protein